MGLLQERNLLFYYYYNNIPVEVFDNSRGCLYYYFTQGTADVADLTITHNNNT